MAERALAGVGDPELGEWRERGRRGIVHLRRRLSADEQRRARIGEPRDVRGTPEEARRLRAVAAYLP